ncbi:MAG: TIGR03663 family protein, partial [Chloroflexi bacterium]|nr:TIGR03663 family protein [Chloroflexota bacterium]
MSELAEPLGLGERQETILDRLVSARVRVNWQVAAYATLIIVAAGMRFWDLGSRALHHDESLHAWTAWKLFEGQGYAHEVWMHGPFQFFGTASMFFLFGVGDYTARIFPAIFGSALVALPFFLRHRLGTAGALIMAVAIAFSPTLLYFSRFARNDIFIAFFTLGLVITLWRYIDERKPRYLYLGALLLGLAFATKESIFINATVLILFLNVWMAVHFWRQIREHSKPDAFGSVSILILLLPFAWAVAALWPFSGRWRKRIGLTKWHPAAAFLIVLGTLMLPQFAAAIQLPLSGLLGISNTDLARSAVLGASRENVLGFFTIAALVGATAIIGLRWNARVWLLAAAAFYIPYALLYTSFFTNLDGFYSGNWGALNYWLSQQDVARGEQPWFYYLMLLPIYEFLPLVFAAPALFYYAVKGDVFRRFLVFWVVATFLGYSYAGEKMPWLSVNTSLPVIVLGAFALGQLVSSGVPRRAARQMGPFVRPLAAGALGMAAVALGVFGPGGTGWIALRVLGIIAASLGTLWLLLPVEHQQTVAITLGLQARRRPLRRRGTGFGRYGVVASSFVAGGLLAFTLVIGVRATYEFGDVPRELLVYTQTSPFVPDVVEGIEAASELSGMGEELPIFIEGGLEPWGWYLRDYNQVNYTQVGEEPPPDAVLVVLTENEDVVQPYLTQYGPPVRFPLRWWFPEFSTYKTLPTADVFRGISNKEGEIELDIVLRFGADFVESLFRGSSWDNWWQYFRDRRLPLDPTSGQEFTFGSLNMVAFFPAQYDIELTGTGTAPEAPASTPIPPPGLPALQQLPVDLVLGQPGDDPGSFNEPAGLTIDSQGNLYVADTFNHRVQKFDPEGNFLAEVGGNGSGEGEFSEPWGLAVDLDGNLYVADTFNHRIQKFDPDFNFLLAFGVPATSQVDPEPEAFWGPRDVAIDPEGNIWVADTGTARMVKYGPDGRFLQAFGGMGEGAGQFQEPTAIEITPGGDIFVADSGNRRVQRFDASFN